MMSSHGSMTFSVRIGREKVYAFVAFVLAAFLFIGFSVFATTIGTHVTASDNVFATGTVQATGLVYAYGGFISSAASSSITDTVNFENGINASSTLVVDGNAILGGASSTISGTLALTGAGTLASLLTLNGSFISSGASSSITDTVNFENGINASSTLLVGGNATLAGASSTISGTLEVSGNVSLINGAKFSLASSTPGADFAASTTNFFIASSAGTTTLGVHARATGIGCLEMTGTLGQSRIYVDGAGTALVVEVGSCD